MSGILYLVATPIGNLEDITLRAIRILKEVEIIVSEDTRQTLKLLNHFEISKKQISYHRHSTEERKQEIINLLLDNKNIALVSDAGTPVISDPGEELVQEAIKNNIQVTPIPGACAAISALITSGIDAKEFTFIGFLPLNKKTRKEKLKEIEESNKTVILYEAPHKLENTLNDLKEILKDRKIVIAKEITKIHEKYFRGTVDELIEQTKDEKGEFVIIIDKNMMKKENEFNLMTLEEHYEYYEKLGYEKKEIIKQIAKDRKIPKNEVYQKFI